MNRISAPVWMPLVIVALLSFGGAAQETKVPGKGRPAASSGDQKPSAEEKAIRASSRVFEEAFNKGDAKAVAACWTKDGDYHDDEGRVYRGRDAIEKAYSQHFAENKGQRMKVAIDSIKLLSDSAAIEDGRVIVDAAPGAPGISKYTAVHVKVDGHWLMSTVRDTHVETPSTYRNLEDFEWMIGTWVAEEHGTKTEFACRWVANKSFLERSYTVTHADQSKTSGLQIIGWNAQEACVQSWNFSSDGGHGIGIWQPHEKGWNAQVRGQTGDGTPTSAVNIFTKLDDNTCTWQSVRRTIGEQTLPDIDEVVIKRQAAR